MDFYINEFNPEPSLWFSFILFLIYIYGTILLSLGTAHGFVLLGFSPEYAIANLSEIIFASQIVITSALTILLMRRYLDFLLSKSWSKNYLQYIKIGLKWASPILFFYALFLIVPVSRENIIFSYLSSKDITIKGASNFTLMLLSIISVLGAIFEEFIFRGILVPKLQKFTNNTTSVLISASLFALSHFVFAKVGISTLCGIFLIGVLSGFAYTSTGSCIASIWPHLLNNIIYCSIAWAVR